MACTELQVCILICGLVRALYSFSIFISWFHLQYKPSFSLYQRTRVPSFIKICLDFYSRYRLHLLYITIYLSRLFLRCYKQPLGEVKIIILFYKRGWNIYEKLSSNNDSKIIGSLLDGATVKLQLKYIVDTCNSLRFHFRPI